MRALGVRCRARHFPTLSLIPDRFVGTALCQIDFPRVVSPRFHPHSIVAVATVPIGVLDTRELLSRKRSLQFQLPGHGIEVPPRQQDHTRWCDLERVRVHPLLALERCSRARERAGEIGVCGVRPPGQRIEELACPRREVPTANDAP